MKKEKLLYKIPLSMKRFDIKEQIKNLEYDFQPVVSCISGKALGYEAFVRNCGITGHDFPETMFEEFLESGILFETEIILLGKACAAFSEIPFFRDVKLFFNIEVETITETEDFAKKIITILRDYKIPPECLVLEIRERDATPDYYVLRDELEALKAEGINIALDNYGRRNSGYELLYYSSPRYLKIDRFLIESINNNIRKKQFLAGIINTAHASSCTVIGVGIQTTEEYYQCRQLGCDFAQGNFIQKPQRKTEGLKSDYTEIKKLSMSDKRCSTPGEDNEFQNTVEYVPPISLGTNMFKVLEIFRKYKKYRFFPIVNCAAEPLGIIREDDLKSLVYSMYGIELMKNSSLGYKLDKFIVSCPVAESGISPGNLLDLYAGSGNPEGVIIVKDLKYTGFLRAESILRIIHEKNMESARDQNPLSKLPGNFMVNRFVSEAMDARNETFVLCYFDFDDFKPFNDSYGFRKGDRAILLFSEILKKHFSHLDVFIGHIGGDDFFTGFRNRGLEKCEKIIREVVDDFRSSAESLYNEEDRYRGYIETMDRHGTHRKFNLLGVSAAAVEVNRGCQVGASFEEVSRKLAELKKKIKNSGKGFDSILIE